jgi:hypothetical protein
MINQAVMNNPYGVLDLWDIKLRLRKAVNGILTGITPAPRHFDKKDDFTIDAKGLRQLDTSTYFTFTSAGTTTHVTDPGTDLLMVLLATYAPSTAGTSVITSATHDSVSLTIAKNVTVQTGSSQPFLGVSIAYLKNPNNGTKNLVVNGTSTGTYRLLALNFLGSQETPLRTASDGYVGLTAAGSISLSPISAVGDIVLDVISQKTPTTWAPGASQTQLYFNTGITPGFGVSRKDGVASNTPMSWSGASVAWVYQASVAIKGSN